MAQGAGRGPKRGIQVRTVRRAVRPDPITNGGSGSARPGTSHLTVNKKRKRPSVRYREKTMGGASRPGENFFADAKMAEQFEQRVLEIYAPTSTSNKSVRELPLRLQALRDGTLFKLPSLCDMCMNVVSNHFSSRVLPFLQRDQIQSQSGGSHLTEPSRKKQKRKVGIFGIAIEDDDDNDHDFLPDIPLEEQATKHRKRKTRKEIPSRNELEVLEYIHEVNSSYLTILPIRAKQALQELLEKKSPQHLNWYVLTKYFLTNTAVAASKSFRALCTVEGVGERGLTILLRSITFASNQGSSGPSLGPAAILEKLHLQAFTRLTTRQILPLLERTNRLQVVNLRGCISIDAAAIKQLVQSSGKTLRIINLNWTGVRVEGIEQVIRECPNLEVLKMAFVQNVNDSTVTAMMERISRSAIEQGFLPLNRLKKLKLRGTQVSNLALASILKHCGSRLESLDISHTRVGGDGCIQILAVLLGLTINESITAAKGTNTLLRKLNISGLSIPEEEMKLLPIVNLEAMRILDCNQMKTIEQQSGHHDLGVGIKPNLVHHLLKQICQLWSTKSDQVLNGQGYHFERLSLSNKLVGGYLQIHDLLHRHSCETHATISSFAVKVSQCIEYRFLR